MNEGGTRLVRPKREDAQLKGCIEEARRNGEEGARIHGGEQEVEGRALSQGMATAKEEEEEPWENVEGGEAAPMTPRISEQDEGERAENKEGGEEEGEEGRIAKGLTAPVRVTKEMREEHEKSHTPYRSWCPFCVRGRGISCGHKKVAHDEEDEKVAQVPRVAMDYGFMSTKDEEAKENPMLVMVNEKTGDKFARAAGSKGIGEEGEGHWLVRDADEELKAWGHTGGVEAQLILKSDGEASIVAFREALGKFHGGVVAPEMAAKGESQSNGTAEAAVRTVRDFTRVLKE